MKKLVGFIMLVTVIMFTTMAAAGPVDWAANKLGYTPSSKLEAAKAETAKAVAAAKAAEEAAVAATAAAELEGRIIGYGGILILALGGLAYVKRKDIARKILAGKEIV